MVETYKGYRKGQLVLYRSIGAGMVKCRILDFPEHPTIPNIRNVLVEITATKAYGHKCGLKFTTSPNWLSRR